MVRRALALIALITASTEISAGADEIAAEARKHYEAGRARFQDHDLVAAKREYDLAAGLRSLPEYDYDLGLLYQANGGAVAAEIYFRSYLAANPNGTHRVDAAAHLASPKRASLPLPPRPPEPMKTIGTVFTIGGLVSLGFIGLAIVVDELARTSNSELPVVFVDGALIGGSIGTAIGLLVGIPLWVGGARREKRLAVVPLAGKNLMGSGLRWDF
jgi:hypothetical protein